MVSLPLDLLLASQSIKILRYGYNDPNKLSYGRLALKAVLQVQQDCKAITA